jgi:uncharacterized protein (DUF1778 family)
MRHILGQESVIRLSRKDICKVLVLIDNPPKPNKRLKEAVRAFRETVRV